MSLKMLHKRNSVSDYRTRIGLGPMTYQSSTTVSEQEEASVQVLGETGGTIVYIYPSGNARVKKGKKSTLINPTQSHSVSNQGNTTQSTQAPRQHHDVVVQVPPSPSSQSNTRAHQKAAPTIQPSVQTNHAKPSSQTTTVKQQLGDYLLKKRLVTHTQLEVAKYDLRTSGLSLEEILLARGWVSSEAIARFHTI